MQKSNCQIEYGDSGSAVTFRCGGTLLPHAQTAGSRFALTAEQSVAEIHSVGCASTTI